MQKKKLIFFLIIYTSFFSSAFTFHSIPPILTALISILNITPFKSGLLMSIYSLLGIIIGLLSFKIIKNIKDRDILILSNLCTLVGLIIPSIFNNYSALLIGRLLSGAGFTILSIRIPGIITKLFSSVNKTSFYIGIYATSVPLAAILSFYILPILQTKYGGFYFLRFNIYITLLALILSILFIKYLIIEDIPENKKVEIYFNFEKFIPLSIIWALFNAGTISFITFSFNYSIQIKHISSTISFFIGSSTMIGGLILASLAGFILDRYKHLIRLFIIIGCMFLGLGFLLFYFSKWYLIIILFLIIGGGIIPISIFSYHTIFKNQSVDKKFSLLAITMGIGSILGPLITGSIMNIGNGIYSYLLMFLFMSTGSLLGTIYLKKTDRI